MIAVGARWMIVRLTQLVLVMGVVKIATELQAPLLIIAIIRQNPAGKIEEEIGIPALCGAMRLNI